MLKYTKMDLCTSCGSKIDQLHSYIKVLKLKILDLEMELKKIKDSQLEQPANVDETREEYLGELGSVNLRKTLESIEASDWINTSDFEDDPNDEIGFKNQLENGDESVEDLVGALTIAEVKIVPINLSLGDDFENHIEEFFAWALKQTEEADKQQNLRDPSENDVVIRSDDLAVETSTTKQQRKFESIVPFDDDFSDNDSKDCGDQERQSIHSHDCHYNQNIHSDDEDFEDTEWQCMYCSDWNSIHEYFCFTYALTQTEEAYEQNSLGNYFKNKANQDFATETSINQQIKVKRSQPFTYNDFDSDDENWQCLHCKDWNSIEEYFCFTCALTQTEETYAKMN